MKKIRISMMITVIAILSSACAGLIPTQAFHLDGTSWVLTTYNDHRPIEGTQPAIRFEDGQVSGNAGCNHYGGSYQVKGDSISFGDLFSTEMACMEPEGVMAQERIYLELLRAARRFELLDGVLTIYAGPQQTLTFEIRPDNPELPAPTLEQPSSISPTAKGETQIRVTGKLDTCPQRRAGPESCVRLKKLLGGFDTV